MTKSSFFKILKKIIFAFFMILTFIIILTLYRCGYFKPQSKVIQYQEEVKLSDGSMIWVDIKRRYGLVGEIGVEPAYMPGIVEISWDTGFEGVGRQSVFFDKRVYFIDNVDGVWYVIGQKYPYVGSRKNIKSINCQDVGYLIERDYDCVIRIDKDGYFIQSPTTAEKFQYIPMNILNTTLLKNDGNPMHEFLDKAKLSWSDKLDLQTTQPEINRLIGRTYSYLVN